MALALLGLFASLYLLWVYTSPSRPIVCLGTGCDAVRASAYSSLFGIPIPVYGVIAYTALALLIFAETLVVAPLSRYIRLLVALGSGVGFLFSLYLSYLEKFVIHAWCAWCVTSAIIVTLLAGLSWFTLGRPEPDPEPAQALAETRNQFELFVAALVIGAPFFYFLTLHGELPPAPQASAETLAERLVRPDSHAMGNPQSPLTVVEFADFECPVCGRTEPAVQEIRRKYGDRVRFVFRQFPLTKIHRDAQKAAEASECAAEQGKFWEAEEKLYAGQSDLSEPALERIAGALALDQARFHQCLATGAMTARVTRDAADARALGLRGTPTFFIGRQMIESPLDYAKFSQLLDQELGSLGTTTTGATTMASTTTKSQPIKPPRRSGSPAADPHASAPLLSGSNSIFSQFQGAGPGCSEEEALKQQAPMIRTDEARKLVGDKAGVQFVDVRAAKDFQGGRIPGAMNLPIDDLAQRWESIPKARTVVFYESGTSPGDVCASSRAAARVLLEHGFALDRVKVFQDGFAGWQKEGLPVER